MKIQQVEAIVGITKKNIRFYEHEGLLSPGRSENGYRDYTPEDVMTLKKIKLLRSLSFPIDEIRRLQNGILTMEDGARRHMIVLEREQASLEKAQCLCREIQEHNETLETLDVDIYLEKMKNMEKEGAVFVDIKKRDHRKEYIAPVTASVIMVLFIGIILFAIITESMAEHLTVGTFLLIALAAAALIAVILGVLFALRQRIKQIQGGEEDAAAKY